MDRKRKDINFELNQVQCNESDLFVEIDFFDLFNAIALLAQGKFHFTMDSLKLIFNSGEKSTLSFWQMQWILNAICGLEFNTLINI